MMDVAAANLVPLVVDLDGTLLLSDLLVETAFARIATAPQTLPRLAGAFAHGRAHLKRALATGAKLDPAKLSYDETVLTRLRQAAAQGRPVYLASASDKLLVEAIGKHLGFFAGVFASDGKTNLKGEAKARKLVEAFGEGQFDYIGNDAADLPVWRRARHAIAVRASTSVVQKLKDMQPAAEVLPVARPDWRHWLKLLRVHQYAKNALVFLPLLTAQQFTSGAVLTAVACAVAFSLCASGVYIVNDCVDLAVDRTHPVKKSRPLASGAIASMDALLAAGALTASAFILAFLISKAFAAVLLGYLALTAAYSFSLKRKMMVDIVALAILYTARVIGGAIAINVSVSEWLLAFSMFMFTALALVKRCAELAMRLDADVGEPANRNYKLGDLSVLAALAAASGFNAVTVFALYISSDTVRRLYGHPQLLWLICPLLTYWFGRMLILAHRRHLLDDPIVFALTDKVSIATVAIIIGVVLLAI